MSDRTGEQFGLYRLVRFIKAGGFGEVYEGTHPRRSQVALKLLNMRLDEQGLRYFLNDVRAVLLHHPQIIEIVDFGVEGQTPYLAMPYFSNGSVRASSAWSSAAAARSRELCAADCRCAPIRA